MNSKIQFEIGEKKCVRDVTNAGAFRMEWKWMALVLKQTIRASSLEAKVAVDKLWLVLKTQHSIIGWLVQLNSKCAPVVYFIAIPFHSLFQRSFDIFTQLSNTFHLSRIFNKIQLKPIESMAIYVFVCISHSMCVFIQSHFDYI